MAHRLDLLDPYDVRAQALWRDLEHTARPTYFPALFPQWGLAAAWGHAIYDLLGGSARYKAALATGATELAWLCVQRDRPRFAIFAIFAIEDRVRDLKHAGSGAFA